MDITVRKQGPVQVIRLRGDLKLGEPVETLRQTLSGLIEGGELEIVLNLIEVRMIDSSGIGLLVRYLTSLKRLEGTLELVAPSKLAVQTMKLVGVYNLFPVFDTEDAAIMALS